MTATSAGVTTGPAARLRPTGADVAVATKAWGQLWKGAVGCGAAFGLTAASSALTYATTFPDEASRQAIAGAMTADRALGVLLGPTDAVATVGGYTVYKGFVFLTTIGALWALLAATRVLRGEEDTGRWQLLLTGATRPARATAATLTAMLAAVLVVTALTAAIVAVAGARPEAGLRAGSSAVYALSLGSVVAVFAAVGAVTSQLARTRRGATGLAAAVFGVAFMVRMVADSGPSWAWLRWWTPLGWAELVAPFTADDLRPVALAAAVTAVGLGAAVVLAARRDAGAGLLPSRDRAALRPFGLGSAFGLTVRLERWVLMAWLAGGAAMGALLGLFAELTARGVPESMGTLLEQFGAGGSPTDQYLGVAFLAVATLTALLPAGQLAAAGQELTAGRARHLFVGPVSPRSWLAGRLALAALALTAVALVAALALWVAARAQGVDLALGTAVGAGLNTVPTALVALGAGALGLVVAPRLAGPAVYVVVASSLVIDIVTSLLSSGQWLSGLSLFHWMALAPGAAVDPLTVVVVTAVGSSACAAAVAVFPHRDLPGA